MLWKRCIQHASKFGKLSSGHRTGKDVFIPTAKKGDAKECSNYCTIALISHASKVMLKFSKPGFNRMWTVNFQMFKLGLEKAEESQIKLPTSAVSLKKQESSRKTSASALLWRRKWQLIPVLLPGEPHGQKSLVGYSPWGHKELDTTEWLHFLLYWLMPKPLTVWVTTNWKILQEMGISDHPTCLLGNLYAAQ